MTRLPLIIPVAALVFACGGRNNTAREEPRPNGSAIVLRGSELSGTLLDAMRVRIPTMTVNTQNSVCPLITFRGARSIRNQGNPSVYVDGTLAGDTCLLQQIMSNDVDRVEVYPNGHVAGATIRANPFGVIIVHRLRQ